MDASLCNPTVTKAGYAQLQWSWSSTQNFPSINEVFYIEVELAVNSIACSGSISNGQFEIGLPTGLELATGRDPICLSGLWNSTPASSSCPSVLTVDKPGTIRVNLGVQSNHFVMVRVPVIAQKPVLNATLKVNFKDSTGVFRAEKAISWTPTITVGGMFWDVDLQKITTDHHSVKIPYVFYNWCQDGSGSFSLRDAQGNYPYSNYLLWSNFDALRASGKKIEELYAIPPNELNISGLQPDTTYFLQMRFLPSGILTIVNSEEVQFQTTPLPRYRLTLHAPNATQGSAKVSPAQGEYPLGTEITLTATPGTGWRLDSWTVNQTYVAPTNPLRLTVESNLEVFANFVIEREDSHNTNNPNVTKEGGGCSQGPQNASWGMGVAALLLAFLARKRKPSAAA